MKKKFVKVMLFGALALSTISYVGCKDYDDDIDGLQQQVDANKSKIEEVDAAMKAGKFIVSYTPVANGYELSLSDGSKLTITNGKDGENGQPGLNGETVIPKFKVSSDNYWQVSTDDGKTYEYVLDADGNKVNATGKKGEQGEPGKPGEPGQDASANVSINKDGYIVIGDVVTSLKTDTKVPSIVINEVDGLYVITLDGEEYKMLAEGSAYNGLQSIIYRRQAANDKDDFVKSIGLMSSNDPDAELLATSASVATFKVWPTTLDLGKAVFAFTDTYKTRALVPALKYVEGSAKWVDNRQGILSVNMISENIEVDKPYASSLDVTINGYTTASDYFNFKAEKWTPADLSFVHTKDAVEVPTDVLADATTESDFSSYVEYTFVYNKSYNLNDSVALGHDVEEDFISMADLGFSGITVEFKQTADKAKGIFEIKDGVITAKSSEQASAINELCYVTATYKNEKGTEIISYDFAVKAVREQQVAPALVDIDVETKDAAAADKLAKLQYSTSEQTIDLNVRAFLNSLGGRDYMSDNENVTPVKYGLYYLTNEDGKTYANKVGAYIEFTPGTSTDLDNLKLIFPAETVINGDQQLYSFETWPGGGNSKYEITNSEEYAWRKSTTTHRVNGSNKQYTLKLKDLVKCERKVIIKQNSAFVVNGKTTITGAWTEADKSFSMTADLTVLYAAYNTDNSTSSEVIEYYLAPQAKQSDAVKAVYSQISIAGNVITVTPAVDVKTLGAIKIGAKIQGTDIEATILDINGKEVTYCEPVLRSPLDVLSYKSSIDWNIDGDQNKTINVGTKAEIKMSDKDINVTKKNVVIENGVAKAPWAAAYGIDAAGAITYAIDGYSATVNEGTYTIDSSTGVITCNNTAIVQSLDIYVKVTVNHNWGTETINKITVKASLK